MTGAITTLTVKLFVTRCSCCCSSFIYTFLLPYMSFVARYAQIYVRVGLLNALRFLGECGDLLSGSADTEGRAGTNRRPARRVQRHGCRRRPVSAAQVGSNWSVSNPVLRWCASVAWFFLATAFSSCLTEADVSCLQFSETSMAVLLGECSYRGARTQRGARVQIAALFGEPDAMVAGGALCRRRSSVLTGLSRTPSCDGVPRLPFVFWLLNVLPVCNK